MTLLPATPEETLGEAEKASAEEAPAEIPAEDLAP